jgi:hypothetical protein
MRFCAIFKDIQIMFFCYLHDLIHITWMSVQMDRDYDFCMRSDFFLDFGHIDIIRISLTIDEYWRGSSIKNCIRRSSKREIGDDHLISFSDSKRDKS